MKGQSEGVGVGRKREKQKGHLKRQTYRPQQKRPRTAPTPPPKYSSFSLLLLLSILFFCIIHAGFHRVYNSASLENEAVWGATEDSSFNVFEGVKEKRGRRRRSSCRNRRRNTAENSYWFGSETHLCNFCFFFFSHQRYVEAG